MLRYTSNVTQPFKTFCATMVLNAIKTPVSPKFNIILHCGDYIEVPGGSDSVPYTDEDGNNYEVPLDDLIDYDGEDGEIQYTKSKKRAKMYYMESTQLRNHIMVNSRIRAY